MAGNSENAPSEPSGRSRSSPEGGSRLRDQFRDSIRDALSGVDVDELQGRKRPLRVPSDVTLLTREAVSDLEEELAKLRAERAELERRAAARAAGGAVVVEAPPAAPAAEPELPEAPKRGGRLPWRRGRGEVEVEVVAAPDGESTVAWSVAAAMEPVAGGGPAALEGAPAPPAEAAPAPQNSHPPAPIEPAQAASAPLPPAPEVPTRQSAPPSRSTKSPARSRSRKQLTDAELESVVAPLLAELSNLRAEVRELRGDPPAQATPPSTNRQLAKLAFGLLLGFALIVVALAVVLKA